MRKQNLPEEFLGWTTEKGKSLWDGGNKLVWELTAVKSSS